MRVAIVSDIHGNLTAFEAVLADLKLASPDLILHGGDLAQGGASPAEIVDQIRDLGWPGVLGNVDEMLFDPQSLTAFIQQQQQLGMLEEMAAATRHALGDERIAWLSRLPRQLVHGAMALVHASPDSTWRAPGAGASDEELESTYGALGQPIGVYGHIHTPYIRKIANRSVVNAGSVSLSFDGDRRAAYVLLDDGAPSIRRVEYDVDQELKALSACGQPHTDWIAKILTTARPAPLG